MGCEDGCPYRLGECLDGGYRSKPMKDALDLINRQKSEIERKSTECERLEIYIDELVKQKLNQAKSEAYREFAEKVKATILSQLACSTLEKKEAYYFCLDEIDNTLKELTESK